MKFGGERKYDIFRGHQVAHCDCSLDHGPILQIIDVPVLCFASLQSKVWQPPNPTYQNLCHNISKMFSMAPSSNGSC